VEIINSLLCCALLGASGTKAWGKETFGKSNFEPLMVSFCGFKQLWGEMT